MTTPIPLPTPDPTPADPIAQASSILPSTVRTLVPLVVSGIVGLPVTVAVENAAGVSGATAREVITSAVTLGFAGVYYVAVRFAESRWPQLGLLLGRKGAPTYGK